jgi:signal transduction histidine kinase
MATMFDTLRAAWRGWWSPYFRDSRGHPLWAALTVTFLFSLAIALTLTAFTWVFSGGRIDLWRFLWINFVVSQAIGFSIHGLFVLAAKVVGVERIDSWRGLRRAALFSAVPLVGVFIGYATGFSLVAVFDRGFSFRWLSGWFVAGALMIWAVLSLFWWRFARNQMRLAEAEQQLAIDRARAADLERQAIDAQLRTLQAQIEPHFLFNTLANVVSLIESQPASARRMLERLIDLLRASLSASRARTATLAQEFELCQAYLDILAIRMGARLRCELVLPHELRALPLPPMLLQPLVENAIQHGLEPKVEGGCIRLAAQQAGDQLEITVQDDGIGFAAMTRAGGVGLSNLRERLAACFGPRARLVIEDARPGTRVRLLLPLPAAAMVPAVPVAVAAHA